MRKMKNYVKFGMLLIGVSLLLWNCQYDSEEIIEPNQVVNTSNLKTVSLDDAKEYFETFQFNQPKAKGTSPLVVTPEWSTFEQKELYYSDALLTNIDVSINRTGDFTTELLYIEVEGELKAAIYTLYKDKLDPEGNIIDARIFLTEVDGKYIDGYRIINKHIATRFVFQKVKTSNKNIQAKMAIVPTSFWGENDSNNLYSGGDGDSEAGGGERDRIALEEVVVIGYLTPEDPYADNEEFFNPINELAGVDDGTIEREDVLGTGISEESVKDAVTGALIDPIVKCDSGFILINGNCVIDTETPCEQEGYVRNDKGICGPAPDQIIENLTDKAECVFNKLQEMSIGFKNLIKKFDGEFPVSHLKFEESSNLSSSLNATTSPPSNYLITITINSNNLNRPNLSIARTIIHETIHAEMFRKILSIIDNGGDLNGLTRSQWTSKLSNGDYPGIFDYYSRYGVNGMQHQQMAAHYISTISDYLRQFQPGLSQETYDSLAWTGLKGTTAWNSLTPSERTTITNTINSFNSQGGENCN